MTEMSIIDRFQRNDDVFQEFSGIHIFNEGKSAFLMKNNNVFEFGEENYCFLNNEKASEPRLIEELKNIIIKSFATGVCHATLLDNNGRVFCWGYNIYGQIGNGKTSRYVAPTCVDIPKIKEISCGGYYTLALTADICEVNVLFYWGNLCNPIQSVKPMRINLSTNIVVHNISVGDEHAAIVDTTGKAYTWGSNDTRQLAQGHTNKYVLKPAHVTCLSNVTYALAASNVTLFVTADHKVFISDTMKVTTEIFQCTLIREIASHWSLDHFGFRTSNERILELKVGWDSARSTECRYTWEVFTPQITPSITPASVGNISGVIMKRNKAYNHEIIDETNQTSFLIDPSNLFNNVLMSDVKIKLSDDYIYGHKFVLYNNSEHFKRLIDESNEFQMLDMSNWDSDAYKTYIKYLYSGKLEINSMEKIPDIYSIAEHDQNKKLMNLCVKYCRDNLTEKNVVRFYQAAFNAQAKELMDSCGKTLQTHLATIITTNDYKILPEAVKVQLVLTSALYQINER